MSTERAIVVKGEDKTIPLRIREKVTGDPYDLTSKVLTGRLVGDEGPVSIAAGSFTVISATLGKVEMTLADTETTLLKKGVQSFEVILTEETDIKIVQFTNQLDVRSRV